VPQQRRRRDEEDVLEIHEPPAAPEELELADFLDNLGPAGVSEVALYRVLPSGKQRFIASGPPSQFSEQYVQVTYGAGDYLARAKLNGHCSGEDQIRHAPSVLEIMRRLSDEIGPSCLTRDPFELRL
jgi:hypothetical protein